MQMIKLLAPEAVEKIKEAFRNGAWLDGKETANGAAKDIKETIQIHESDTNFAPLFNQLKGHILNSDAINTTSFPRHIMNMRAMIYTNGGHYDWHVDAPYMYGFRSDISFTIFLSEPDSYDGGELLFDHGTHKNAFKGKVGDMCVYPTGVLHKVNPVTSGERFVLVGWMESFIKDNVDREQLFMALTEIDRLQKTFKIPSQEMDRLNRAIVHMRRTLST